jgi:5-methylcytosine-specific restriction endonuclease McrA
MKAVMGENVKIGEKIYGNDQYVYRKFKSIEAIDEEVVVYNFETESHSYIANGLAVHNCMYCGVKKKDGSELELEHIIPKSRGGRNVWENLVAACQKCNRAKNDRTPEEAGMTLIHKPLPATVFTAAYVLKQVGAEIREWDDYLWSNNEGDKRYAFIN